MTLDSDDEADFEPFELSEEEMALKEQPVSFYLIIVTTIKET